MRQLKLMFAISLLAGAGMAHADPVDLKPFRASYTLEWKGITAGGTTLELKQAGPDSYTYSSVAAARGVFRLAFSDSVTQSSTFRIVDGRVVPQNFRGIDEKERPIELTFDWTKKRITGVAKGHPVDLDLADGTQDPMSLQIASLRNLAAGALQGTIRIVDSDKLKDFELKREGTRQIETAIGTLDTIIYSSKRAGGDRITRTYVAPALGYLPVRAERVRGEKIEFTLLIESVDR